MFTRIGSVVLIVSFAAVVGAQTGGTSSTTPDSAKEPVAATGKTPPGMNSNGEVIDASKVERGYGQTVKGINDYEGEITGIAALNSKFTQLQIGMSMKQATDIAGQPTDQGSYITGKAFIPFYFGGSTSLRACLQGGGPPDLCRRFPRQSNRWQSDLDHSLRNGAGLSLASRGCLPGTLSGAAGPAGCVVHL